MTIEQKIDRIITNPPGYLCVFLPLVKIEASMNDVVVKKLSKMLQKKADIKRIVIDRLRSIKIPKVYRKKVSNYAKNKIFQRYNIYGDLIRLDYDVLMNLAEQDIAFRSIYLQELQNICESLNNTMGYYFEEVAKIVANFQKLNDTGTKNKQLQTKPSDIFSI